MVVVNGNCIDIVDSIRRQTVTEIRDQLVVVDGDVASSLPRHTGQPDTSSGKSGDQIARDLQIRDIVQLDRICPGGRIDEQPLDE